MKQRDNMSLLSVCTGGRDIASSVLTLLVYPYRLCFFIQEPWALKSRILELSITTTNAAEIVRNFMAEDVEPVQDEQEPQTEYFRYITKLAIEQKRAEIVDAEIRAACRGTAEMLWRTLWNNENLGYVEVEFTDATTLYRDIEKRYGKLPYSDRQFRAARNKR